MNSALEETKNKNVLSACSLFDKLPKIEAGNYEKLRTDVQMLTAKERFHIFDLLDKIMISLNEIPWESITLSNFKHWCDLYFFRGMLCYNISDKIMDPKILTEVNESVKVKIFRFFFRGLIHFKKMNIKIVDANIPSVEWNAQKTEGFHNSFKENILKLASKRIKNCQTIQDLIDGSPNKECPVCMDVTFTEETDFIFRVSCNHLLCPNCECGVFKINKLV